MIEHHPTKAASRSNQKVFLSAEKMSVEDKSDSETQQSVFQKPKKLEQEDLKTIKMAESLIDDYREVLHHAFKNLSSRDPNFVRQAVIQDREVERKTGIQLHDLPRAQNLDGLYQLGLKDSHTENYMMNIPTQNQPDWNNQPKQMYAFPSPYNGHSVPSYLSTITTSLPTPPSLASGFLAIPMILNASPQLMSQQPIQLKPLEGISPIPNLPPNSFQPTHIKNSLGDSPLIPDLKMSPQLKAHKGSGHSQSDAMSSNFALELSPNKMNGTRLLGEPVMQKTNVLEPSFNLSGEDLRADGKGGGQSQSNEAISRKNSLIDQNLNQEESSNGNYHSILNSMEQSQDLIKKPVPFNAESMSDKSIKKNNIILTRNSFSNA